MQAPGIYAGYKIMDKAKELFQMRAGGAPVPGPIARVNGQLKFHGVRIVHDPALDTAGLWQSMYVVPETDPEINAVCDRFVAALNTLVDKQKSAAVAPPAATPSAPGRPRPLRLLDDPSGLLS